MSDIEYQKVNIVLRKDQHVFCKEYCINISKLSRNSIDNLREKLEDPQAVQDGKYSKQENKGDKSL